jgi:AmiR/NasT family two-component response regulator
MALLDFPRRERLQQAIALGATAVLGKPWQNDALVATLESCRRNVKRFHAA